MLVFSGLSSNRSRSSFNAYHLISYSCNCTTNSFNIVSSPFNSLYLIQLYTSITPIFTYTVSTYQTQPLTHTTISVHIFRLVQLKVLIVTSKTHSTYLPTYHLRVIISKHQKIATMAENDMSQIFLKLCVYFPYVQ